MVSVLPRRRANGGRRQRHTVASVGVMRALTWVTVLVHRELTTMVVRLWATALRVQRAGMGPGGAE